jgi:hypothetical protein
LFSKNKNEIVKGKERCEYSPRKLLSRRILVMGSPIGSSKTPNENLNMLPKKPWRFRLIETMEKKGKKSTPLTKHLKTKQIRIKTKQ